MNKKQIIAYIREDPSRSKYRQNQVTTKLEQKYQKTVLCSMW